MENPERDVAVYGAVAPTRLAGFFPQPPFPARGFGVWICGQRDKYDKMPDMAERTPGQPILPPQWKITYIPGILCRESKIFAGMRKGPFDGPNHAQTRSKLALHVLEWVQIVSASPTH